jgi:hypothetical protein
VKQAIHNAARLLNEWVASGDLPALVVNPFQHTQAERRQERILKRNGRGKQARGLP